MKTLIVYNSIHHQNTEKIALAIAKELNADIAKVFDLRNFDLSQYDLIGLGSGIYMGRHHSAIFQSLEKFLNIDKKRFFIFSTSGLSESFFNNFNKPLKERIISKGGRVIGSFNCSGFDSNGLIKFIGGIKKDRPNEKDIANAIIFAKDLKPKVLTLCLARNQEEILLGMKKRGFGEGRWNGFGGKLEKGETIIEGAKREIFEESGLKAESIKEAGIMDFDFLDTNKYLEVHIFEIIKYSGTPMETEEMKPKWFNILDIPFEDMWPDDNYWLPLFLDCKEFKGRILFENSNKIIRKEINIINSQDV